LPDRHALADALLGEQSIEGGNTVAKGGCIAADVNQNETVPFVNSELCETHVSLGEPDGPIHTRRGPQLPS
jgi:hypothetical protein